MQQHRSAEVEQHWSKLRQVPHDEHTLATLLNVHIVGGSVDLSTHLDGATLRPAIVEQLIARLRTSGYPGYEENGPNSASKVRQRIESQYVRPYGAPKFVPRAVQEAIKLAREQRVGRQSLVYDKNATPAEPATSVQALSATLRPLEIVAERSSQSMSEAHNEYGTVFQKYLTLDIHTGSTMMNQFHPQYIGMAHPYTWPAAVGGPDIPGHERWRRPDEGDKCDLLPHIPRTQRALLWPQIESAHVVGGAFVRIFDITRSMSQRIEGQFRRNWSFIPGLWNLYFRERVNLGLSLKLGTQSVRDEATKLEEQDAAVAAADLMKKLTNGTFTTVQGKRRKINGDTTKLMYADGITPLQKKLLSDFRFRTRLVPGTREVRTKMGHIGFWASIVYGQGIFITVSPSERHNYLAIRLSRYRKADPYVTANPGCTSGTAADKEAARVQEERKWIGKDKPSLEATYEDSFEFDIPGYDMRRLIMARDPLCAVNAFDVYIRQVLATALGMRMCQDCPHCAETDTPCQDAHGSSAEIMGGMAGRGDALSGGIECQKSSGSLHLHTWFYGQRLHQFKSLYDIADAINQGLVNATDLKDFLSNICVESYPDIAQHRQDLPNVEKNWPVFLESRDAGGVLMGRANDTGATAPSADTCPSTDTSRHQAPKWGDLRLGRLPQYVRKDCFPNYGCVHDVNLLSRDAENYREKHDRALQYFQERCQHHMHPTRKRKRNTVGKFAMSNKRKRCGTQHQD